MKLSTLLTSVVAFAVMASPAAASTGDTLDIVKKRGHLRCQVGTPSGGFYNLDADGNWYGLDVSVCEAVAAAIFGDKRKWRSNPSVVRHALLLLPMANLIFYAAQRPGQCHVTPSWA